jgi:hypothetical protein
MKKHLYLFSVFLFMLLISCATPGQKYIDIAFQGDTSAAKTGTIGIAPFMDKRSDMDPGYVGYRILMDNSQETYFVNGMNLSETLKRTVTDYFSDMGYTVSPIDPWDAHPAGVKQAPQEFQQVLSGQINQFECRARKKGPATEMVLDIDLTFYLGIIETSAVKTIPVSLTLERTELSFSLEKLEQFINQSLAEVMKKAMEF